MFAWHVNDCAVIAQDKTCIQTGHIVGQVLFNEVPLQLSPLVSKDDPRRNREICSFDVVPDERLVVDSQTKGVRNVFVWLNSSRLDSASSTKVATSAAKELRPLRWIIKDCRLQPHVLIVPANRRLQFVNYDATSHRPLEFPVAGQPFDIHLPPAYRLPSKHDLIFQEANRLPVPVKCREHPWICGYRLTLNHNWATVTDHRGRFELRHVPAGTHEIIVWHELKGYLWKQSINVQNDKTELPVVHFELNQKERQELGLTFDSGSQESTAP